MAEVSEYFLQGYKNAEDLELDDVIDGICGRVIVVSRDVKPRTDMAPLIILRAQDGQGLRYEPGFPVAVYGPEKVWLDKTRTDGKSSNPWQRAHDDTVSHRVGKRMNERTTP